MADTVLKTIKARSSIRKYTDEKLTEAELQALKEAALASPTARNLQNQRFFFITNEKILDDIDKAAARATHDGVLPENFSRITYGAPLVVIIGITKESRYGLIDSGIAVQSLALEAKELGLDSVILGMVEYAVQYWLAPEAKEIRAEIGMDDELEFAIAISIGHKATDKEPHSVDFEHIIDVK